MVITDKEKILAFCGAPADHRKIRRSSNVSIPLHSYVFLYSTYPPFLSELTMTKNSVFWALVIDNDPLARDELCQLLNESNEVQVLAEAANAI